VKKDAGMLDAFGKGASADIQLAKQELYAQVRDGKRCICEVAKECMGGQVDATGRAPVLTYS